MWKAFLIFGTFIVFSACGDFDDEDEKMLRAQFSIEQYCEEMTDYAHLNCFFDFGPCEDIYECLRDNGASDLMRCLDLSDLWIECQHKQ
jgi:hypothetical protein